MLRTADWKPLEGAGVPRRRTHPPPGGALSVYFRWRKTRKIHALLAERSHGLGGAQALATSPRMSPRCKDEANNFNHSTTLWKFRKLESTRSNFEWNFNRKRFSVSESLSLMSMTFARAKNFFKIYYRHAILRRQSNNRLFQTKCFKPVKQCWNVPPWV